jgi:hypothetical protein
MQDDHDEREPQTGSLEASSLETGRLEMSLAGNSAKEAKGNRRQDRLKQALRENLKRRKSQARGRDDLTSAPSNIDDRSPYDGSGGKPGK